MNNELTYRFEDEIILIKGNGDYSLNAVYELIGEVMQEAETLEKISILYDAREATAGRSNTEVRQFVSDIASHWPGRIYCIATVVSSDLRYERARLGKLLARVKGCETEYFRDIKLAKRWIAEKNKKPPSRNDQPSRG
jgi:hypothetical protein